MYRVSSPARGRWSPSDGVADDQKLLCNGSQKWYPSCICLLYSIRRSVRAPIGWVAGKVTVCSLRARRNSSCVRDVFEKWSFVFELPSVRDQAVVSAVAAD